ncbi:hypothetical protein BDW60DRAFT_187361 [Aspergillus nidulans var. acristatus]
MCFAPLFCTRQAFISNLPEVELAARHQRVSVRFNSRPKRRRKWPRSRPNLAPSCARSGQALYKMPPFPCFFLVPPFTLPTSRPPPP